MTRLAVLISAVGAVALQTWLHRRGWPNLERPVAVCLIIGVLLGARWPRIAIAAVMVLACLAAGLTDVLAQYRSTGADLFWQALVAGVLIGNPLRGWSLPSSWLVPIRYWAAAIACSWPVVALRETGFDPAMLGDYRAVVTSIGIPPAVQVAWIASVGAIALMGILWCDLLFRVSRDRTPDVRDFATFAIVPFVAGASIASAVGVYQSAVDIEFLNLTFFGALGRASGTMLDGNAFGAAAALAAAGAFAVAAFSRSWSWKLATIAAGALCCAGAWSSASRTALLIVVTAGVGVVMAGCLSSSARTRRLTFWSGGALALVIGVALLAIPLDRWGGPMARLSDSLGTRAWSRSASTIARDLVERDGYGTIGHGLIRDFPVSGVGIGSYHALAIDYSRYYGVDRVRPDNAQNWFRHQLAELGILGSLGWVLWIGPFAMSAKTAITNGRARSTALIVSGGLGGLAMASMLGVPAQNAVVHFAFWTMAAWLGLLAAVSDAPPVSAARARGLEKVWRGALTVLLVVFFAFTVWTALTTLRVSARAAQTRWPYEHGIQGRADDLTARWTADRAVIVFEPHGKFLALRFEVRHPDVAVRPVEVTVRMAGDVVLRTRVKASGIFEGHLAIPDPEEFPVLELSVDRTFTDPETGAQRGLLLHPFTFVDEAPGETWRFR